MKKVWMVLSCLMVAALELASCRPSPAEEKENQIIHGKVIEKEAPSPISIL